jgi:hypothetical protein
MRSSKAISTRAISTFVALSSGRSLNPSRATARARLVAVTVALWIVGLFPTPLRPLFLGLALLTSGIFWIEKQRIHEFHNLDEEGASAERRRLMESLNRHRARVGLEAVLDANVLYALESSAFQWEQIESMLTTRSWIAHSHLREEVQYSADEYMSQIVQAHLVNPRSADIEGKTRKLARLLQALEALDRTVFVYPRPKGVPEHMNEEIPLLPSAELDELNAALITSGN